MSSIRGLALLTRRLPQLITSTSRFPVRQVVARDSHFSSACSAVGQGMRKRWEKDELLEQKYADLRREAATGNALKAVEGLEQMQSSSELFDWMVIQMVASVISTAGWSSAKKLLEKQYLSKAQSKRYVRFASVDECQIEAAIEKVLDAKHPDSFDIAKDFYRSLISMRFCKVKDGGLEIFVRECLERNNISDAIGTVNEIMSLGKCKSIKNSLLRILVAAQSHPEVEEEVDRLLRKYAPSSSMRLCLQGSVLLSANKSLEFVELLKMHDHQLSEDDLRLIIDLAVHFKNPNILLSLHTVREVLNLGVKLRDLLYCSITEIFGRMKDVDGLRLTWDLVKDEQPIEEFAVSVRKLRHFFHCVNIMPPADLIRKMKNKFE
ncbi:hypothetical protein AB6A40_008640 [Gnathostoma spinigerum]|uniref:Uncharacterized protein n=1 Tax=Gnathostoma spinigerum TaxID=75299 RepID=A0ABD6ERI6_9BILA